jgi:hypothetical protein
MISVVSYDVVEVQIHTNTDTDSNKCTTRKGVACSGTAAHCHHFSLGNGQTRGQESECDGKDFRGRRVFDFRNS